MANADVNAEAVGIAKSLRAMLRPDGKPASVGQRAMAFVDQWLTHTGYNLTEIPRGVWRPGQADALTGEVALLLGATRSEVYRAYLVRYRVSNGLIAPEFEQAIRNGEMNATNAFDAANAGKKGKKTKPRKQRPEQVTAEPVAPAPTVKSAQPASTVRLSVADNLVMDLATSLAKAEAQSMTIASMVGKIGCAPDEGAALVKLLEETASMLRTQSMKLFHFLNSVTR